MKPKLVRPTRHMLLAASVPPHVVRRYRRVAESARTIRTIINLPIGAAIVGVTLSITAAVGAAGITASFDSFASESANFGAPWDLSAGAGINEQTGTSDLVELIRNEPDVEAAAGIVGTDAVVGDHVAWLQAFQPIDGVDTPIAPVITEGRAPATIDEIALGATTMAEQEMSIGDTIAVQPSTSATGDESRVTSSARRS